jgi:hypothetical protein
MTKRTKLIARLVLQSCSTKEEGDLIYIDNYCISAYEEACLYLVKKKVFKEYNERTYFITKKMEDKIYK